MKHYAILFNRKSGKIIKSIEAFSSAMLKMYALNGNVSSTRDYVVFNEDGIISFYCEGQKNDFPKICDDMTSKNVEELCAGLLDEIKKLS